MKGFSLTLAFELDDPGIARSTCSGVPMDRTSVNLWAWITCQP